MGIYRVGSKGNSALDVILAQRHQPLDKLAQFIRLDGGEDKHVVAELVASDGEYVLYHAFWGQTHAHYNIRITQQAFCDRYGWKDSDHTISQAPASELSGRLALMLTSMEAV